MTEHMAGFAREQAILFPDTLDEYIAERQLAVLPDVKVGIARIFHAYGPNICLKEDRSQVIGSLIRKAIRYPREDFVVWGAGPRGGPSSTSTTSWTACSG